MLESRSNPQKTRQVFKSALKNIFVLGFAFLVGDILSGIG